MRRSRIFTSIAASAVALAGLTLIGCQQTPPTTVVQEPAPASSPAPAAPTPASSPAPATPAPSTTVVEHSTSTNSETKPADPYNPDASSTSTSTTKVFKKTQQ